MNDAVKSREGRHVAVPYFWDADTASLPFLESVPAVSANSIYPRIAQIDTNLFFIRANWRHSWIQLTFVAAGVYFDKPVAAEPAKQLNWISVKRPSPPLVELAISFQQFPLPVHQFQRVFVSIARQLAERGAAGDERRVNAKLVRVRVPPFFQFAKAPQLHLRRAMK